LAIRIAPPATGQCWGVYFDHRRTALCDRLAKRKTLIMTIKLVAALAIAGLLAVGGGIAYASGSDEHEEATALQAAKITLTQAIATAEQQTGGKAFDAGVDIERGQTRIAVETNGPKGVQTVTVDAMSGLVLATHAGGEKD
jgi:uncharacterized membrane protein YkoI